VPLLRLRNMMDASINSTLVLDMRISNNNDIDDIVALKVQNIKYKTFFTENNMVINSGTCFENF
jgi:hypothetical protein